MEWVLGNVKKIVNSLYVALRVGKYFCSVFCVYILSEYIVNWLCSEFNIFGNGINYLYFIKIVY